MRIGIVGLGLGGASLGAALARRGVGFSLYEQAAEVREVGAGVAIWPNAMRLFERLGLGPRLETIGTPFKAPICDFQGVIRQWVRSESRLGGVGHTLHRAEFLETLASLIPPENLHLGKRCIGAEEGADGVRLSFQDGTSEVFDLVIGADGIKSTLLAAVTDPSEPTYSNLAAYRGLIANTPDLDVQHPWVWTDRKRYMIVFPVSSGRKLNFVGVVPRAGSPEESWFARGDRDDLAAQFHAGDPRLRRIVGKVQETFLWGLFFRPPLRTIVTSRIALMGDAAHPMLIHAGQGVNQAIEDAFALAVLLAHCTARDVPRRLRMYQALRLERATAVQTLSRRNAQFMHEAFPLEAGEERPSQLGETDWIIDHDVEQAAENLLRQAA